MAKENTFQVLSGFILDSLTGYLDFTDAPRYECTFPGCDNVFSMIHLLNRHIVTAKHGDRKDRSGIAFVASAQIVRRLFRRSTCSFRKGKTSFVHFETVRASDTIR